MVNKPFLIIFIFILIALFFALWTTRTFTIQQNTASNNNLNSDTLVPPPATQSATKMTSPTSNPKPSPPSQPVFSGTTLRVPILTYHYIGNNPNPNDFARNNLSVPPDKLEEQMKYLSDNGYSTISLDTLYAALKKQTTLSPKTVILSFDDGYMDFYYNAYPILRRYNIHATSFIPTGLMNQGYYLTWDQIKEMQSSGLISFQAHGVHHLSLPSLSQSALEYELRESKNVLQSQIGVPVNFMAYPYGTFDDRVIDAVKKAGYMGAAATWGSKTQSEGTIYASPRFKVSGSMSLSTFISLL